MLHPLHTAAGGSSGPQHLPVLEAVSKLRRAVDHPFGVGASVLLDHAQVLHIFVGLEVQLARVQLHNYAPDGPDVAQVVPLATSHDHFWRSVLPSIHDLAVMLLLLGGSSEIDYSHAVVLRQKNFFDGSALVFVFLEAVLLQKHILWFEVSMSISNFVHKPDRPEDLFEEGLH